MNFNLKNLVKKNIKRDPKSSIPVFNDNPFDVCEVCDPAIDNIEEVKMLLVSVKTIYFMLNWELKQKPIYLNLAVHDMFAYASYKKEFLLHPDPINNFLEFEDYQDLKEQAIRLIEEHRLYQESIEKDTL